MARPSKYETHVKPKLDIIAAWMRNGATMEQVSQRLGIHVATMCEYQKKYSELYEVLKFNAEQADLEIENMLYKTAKGFEYEETKMIVEADGKKRVEKTKKFYPPNQTAMIFWLKNRQAKRWRDKQHVFQQSTQVQKFEYDNLSDEELAKEEQVLDTVNVDDIDGFEFDGEGELH